LQDSEPIKDFTLADSRPLEGDHVWASIRWKSHTDISELKGKKLQLHVVLTKAKIYGYRIVARKAD
jgi:hypothetical protein